MATVSRMDDQASEADISILPFPTNGNWRNLTPPGEFQAVDVPNIETEDVPACPVCGAEAYEEFTVGFDYELRTCCNPWRFVQCQECSHVWLNPRPALDTLGVIYPSTYYSYNYQQQISPVAVWAKGVLDRVKMSGILRNLDSVPQAYLDIGCGDGRFLRVMERRGLAKQNIFGLELDERVVQPLQESGFNAFCKRVEDCDEIPQDKIDLATMFHVIEHVDDPAGVVRKVADWLAPGGVFAIETPNLEGMDARWFRDRYWGGYHIPRHWNLFTPATLTRLLTGCGLEVISTSYQTGHSFWMYSFHHKLRYAARPWPRLAKLFDPLRSLPFLAAFTAFDKLRAVCGFRTSAMLVLARRKQ
jgi:SAM-dependent methyltransferase